MVIDELLIKAKDGDKEATKQILEMYKPLVYKFSLKYFVVGYTDEDLRQRGYESILEAIKKYDVERVGNFSAYIKGTFMNNFNVLVRNTMKLKGVGSLNYTNEQGFEIMDLIESEENIEEEIIYKENLQQLKGVLSNFSKEDREFILFIHKKNSGAISEYSKLTGISYKKCIRMRDRIMKKLRELLLK